MLLDLHIYLLHLSLITISLLFGEAERFLGVFHCIGTCSFSMDKNLGDIIMGVFLHAKQKEMNTLLFFFVMNKQTGKGTHILLVENHFGMMVTCWKESRML